ncbi:MAG: sigma-70 family RNA polymerase sigma factor [Erythrobacter sp.]|jgi:RNA polymerase sigma factor for flagellar operon FliA|nr:sigma-70 family RNA polymerase sigma factor [Erythrobacter sp.]
MKHDPSGFAPYAAASRAEVEERVRRFLPLVRRAAWHVYGSGHEGLEIEDLIQTGILALTQCAQRHAGPQEDGFAAYAKIRVRGAMLDILRQNANDTRTARARRRDLARAREHFTAAHGREPSRMELAAALGINDADLAEIEASAVSIGSIEDAYDESNTAFASDEPDPFDQLTATEDTQRLLAAMEQLPDRLKLVLQLFFVEELNLTEIAAVLEVSVPRVHQLRAKALKDLRASMEDAA